MAYDNELVLKAVKAYIAAGIEDALDDVEADWAASDPVTLPDPVTYFEGYKPTFLEMESVEFPLLAVMVDARKPESGGDQKAEWGYQEQVIECVVSFVVVADTEETVNKIAHRYAQAVVDLMQAQKVFAGYSQVDYEPAVTLSPASRHPKTHESSLMEAAQTDFIKGGAVETTMEGG